jgi:hypothetical protein
MPYPENLIVPEIKTNKQIPTNTRKTANADNHNTHGGECGNEQVSAHDVSACGVLEWGYACASFVAACDNERVGRALMRATVGGWVQISGCIDVCVLYRVGM